MESKVDELKISLIQPEYDEKFLGAYCAIAHFTNIFAVLVYNGSPRPTLKLYGNDLQRTGKKRLEKGLIKSIYEFIVFADFDMLNIAWLKMPVRRKCCW
ncbi:hypothetical protein C2G38_2182810 [Gigaspora rosea]|uniref:Uncharacterized protein n=1 Tax=Gigaspora rosea TaxID=44941 RepID=A0A397VAK9_9GLOM|nr:hypothetical protein C2G38_2182810 [Gigaspora rosea]